MSEHEPAYLDQRTQVRGDAMSEHEPLYLNQRAMEPGCYVITVDMDTSMEEIDEAFVRFDRLEARLGQQRRRLLG
jgi:hypothetical protein